MPPKTFLQLAVDRLYKASEFLKNNFETNYRDEKNRQRLKDGYDSQAAIIQKELNTLAQGKLATPLSSPKSAFNSFVSAWNDGTGDLLRSYNSLAEFWRLLSNAKQEIDVLITTAPASPGLAQPPVSAKPTTADLDQFQKLATAANELLEPFEACVKMHQPAEASQIAELVRQVNELLKIDPSQAAVKELKGPKSAWASFTGTYKSGQNISQAGFAMLKEFESMMQAANKNIRQL